MAKLIHGAWGKSHEVMYMKMSISLKTLQKFTPIGDFLSGPVVDSTLPWQGAQVQSLVGTKVMHGVAK